MAGWLTRLFSDRIERGWRGVAFPAGEDGDSRSFSPPGGGYLPGMASNCQALLNRLESSARRPDPGERATVPLAAASEG